MKRFIFCCGNIFSFYCGGGGAGGSVGDGDGCGTDVGGREEGKKKKIVSSHGNIRIKQFNQRFPQPLEEGVLNCHRHRDRHPDRQTDMATL